MNLPRVAVIMVAAGHITDDLDCCTDASVCLLQNPLLEGSAFLEIDTEDNVDGINGWFYETYRDQPWSSIHRDWRDGFLRFLELGAAITERDLLDSSRYPWLHDYPLALVLVASYEHHQEHLDGDGDQQPQRHRRGR